MTGPLVKPLGELFVEGITLAKITEGAPDAATKYARAQVALAIASEFQQAATGDVEGALAAAETTLLGKITDPGEAALVSSVFTIANQYIALAAQANGALPLVNATLAGAATEIANGITAVASQYQAPAPAPTHAA